MFSALKKTARAREYENALQWLQDAGLILRANLVKTAKLPLSAYADRSNFKIYVFDVGLLGALAKLSPEALLQGEHVFTEFKGALVENFVAQQLVAHHETALYYWKSGGTAEVDFLCERGNAIFPLEAKAGVNPHSKSLAFYAQNFRAATLSRTTLLNLKHDGSIYNYPLYAISLFPKLLSASAKPR